MTFYTLVRELKIRGFLNLQVAVKGGEVYLIEANPRASRTVPFLSKAMGVPLTSFAMDTILGGRIRDFMPHYDKARPDGFAVKEVVLPFKKFPGLDPILGPEMKSTGEVMGTGKSFGEAYLSAQKAAGMRIPNRGEIVFLSVGDEKKHVLPVLSSLLSGLGMKMVATRGTHLALERTGKSAELVNKINEGRPDIRDLIKGGEIKLVINIPSPGYDSTVDGQILRTLSLERGIPIITTTEAALAFLSSIDSA